MNSSQKILALLCLVNLCFISCSRNGDDLWDDTKSAGRHLQRCAKAMAGYHDDSRQIRSRSQFECLNDQYVNGVNSNPDWSDYNYAQEEPADYAFVPLEDPDGELAMADYIARQPKETPGEAGSSIPGIEFFQDPNDTNQTRGIFDTIYFGYNSSLIQGNNNDQALLKIASYMKSHPRVHLFIEGHTDQRGAQAYNLALGSRRANSVRDYLIELGVNPDNLHTISYGKERLVTLDNHEGGWSKNRRAEFKIYEN